MKISLLSLLALLLVITSGAQNVGIGTNTPTRAKLELHGSAGNNTNAIFGADGAGVSFQYNQPAIGFNQFSNIAGGIGGYIGNGYAAVQRFDAATGTMTFDMIAPGNAGNVVSSAKRALSMNYTGEITVGVGNQGSTLTVNRGTANATAFFFGSQYHSAFNFGADQSTYIRAGKNAGYVYLNDVPNGKVSIGGLVGINTVTPESTFEIRQVDGQGFALVEPSTFAYWDFNIVSTPSSWNLRLNAGGTLKGWFNSSGGNYNHVSDGRLKTDIQVISPVLSRLLRLRPVSYQMIHNNPAHKTSIGFIAQEVKELFPELVTVSRDHMDGYTGIDDLHLLNYEGVSVVTVKAIQEQQAILRQQQTVIDQLKMKLRELKERINRMPASPAVTVL